MTHKLTSTQPEPVRQTIYGGGRKVEPMDSANQPEVLPKTRVHGVKKTATVKVRLKDSDDDREIVIGESDFDESKHERLD